MRRLANWFVEESNVLEESVIYQDILQRGVQRGMRLGKLKLVLIQLEQRFGKLTEQTRRQIDSLPVSQLEELGKALLSFGDKAELRAWLKHHTAARVRE
jgi:predicted transposase YdaD